MSAQAADVIQTMRAASEARMKWDRDQYLAQELSDQAYLITWQRMSTGMYYRAYTPGGRILDAGGGQLGHKRCRQACELHLVSGRRA